MKTKAKSILLGCVLFSPAFYGQWMNGTSNPSDTYWNAITNSVAIGMTQPSFKLDVIDDDSNPGTISGNFVYNNNGTSGTLFSAVRGYYNTSSGNINPGIGIDGEAIAGSVSNNSAISYGIRGKGSGGGINYGGYFSSSSSTSGSGLNAGAYGIVTSNGAGINTGLFGDNGNQSNAFAGYFLGDIKVVNNASNESKVNIYNSAGQEWTLNSLGSSSTPSGSHFSVRDASAVDRLFIQSSGNVGIGNTAPSYKLDISTATAGDGFRVRQSGNSGSAKIHLYANNTGGDDWIFNSYGSGDSQGAGNFEINNGGGTTSMFFDGSSGYVGIANSSPTSRLHVVENSSAIDCGIFDLTTNSAGLPAALTGNASVSGASTDARGVVGTASNGTSNNYGVFGQNAGSAGSGTNAGVYGSLRTAGSGTNAGLYGFLTSSGGVQDAAVFGDDNGLSNGTSIWAGFFTGDVNIIGSCYQNFTWQFSDMRLKKNIEQLNDIRSKIQRLSGYSYLYRVDEFKERRFDDKRHLGLLAQEVKEVFPELIREDAKGYFAVDYQGMIPVLLEAIKDLQNQVNELSEASSSERPNHSNINNAGSLSGENSNGKNFVGQNIPNPFSLETTINYSVPSNCQNAYIAIYDLAGKQLTTFSILKMGDSSITINAENLAAGIYLYCIVADGSISESKRMIIANK